MWDRIKDRVKREPAIVYAVAAVVLLFGIDQADLAARLDELVEILAKVGTVVGAVLALRHQVTPTVAPRAPDGAPLIPDPMHEDTSSANHRLQD